MGREDVRAELADVVSGGSWAGSLRDEIVIFDSTGTALQDVAAAALVYECARSSGAGLTVDPWREWAPCLNGSTSSCAIPSVSTKTEHRGDVVRCAEWLVAELRRIGLAAECHATPGHPVVLAEWRDAPSGAPTVLIYGHYDVQPPEPLDLWNSPPFVGTVRDGRLYARGAADDKGQLWIHIKAVEACLRSRGTLPVNIVMLIEGEEEVGSPSLPGFLAETSRAAGVRLHRDLRHDDVRAGRPEHSCVHARPGLLRAYRSVGSDRSSLGPVRGSRCECGGVSGAGSVHLGGRERPSGYARIL